VKPVLYDRKGGIILNSDKRAAAYSPPKSPNTESPKGEGSSGKKKPFKV